MKVIRNGRCYVERNDITFYFTLDKNEDELLYDTYVNGDINLFVYKDPEAIKRINSKPILDFDDLVRLSNDEVNILMDDLYKSKIKNKDDVRLAAIYDYQWSNVANFKFDNSIYRNIFGNVNAYIHQASAKVRRLTNIS